MNMTKLFAFVSVCFFAFFATDSAFAQEQDGKKVRVLFTFGGHEFQEKEMYQMLDSFADVTYVKAEMPKALDLFKPGLEKEYDCLVMYDFYTFPYTKEQMENYKKLLETGIGVVVLHHCIGGFSGSEDYPKMIGGQYITAEKAEIDGKTYPMSTWLHDQTMNVKVADKEHPIMKGISDYTIVDEAYHGVYVSPKAHVLLTTDYSKSTEQLAWTWKYGKSKVFTTMLGHDKLAYENPNFKKMVHQAIRWAIEK